MISPAAQSHPHVVDVTRRPDLFIIGAPKSGTTSLYEYLDGHPDVYMSPVKEPFYFCPDVQGGVRRHLRFGDDVEEYLSLFEGAREEKHLGEASTRYFVSRVAPELIHEFQPEARIVAMVRNPVDMIYALHSERVFHDAEDITDFEQALAADDDRRAGQRLPDGANELGAVYREHARVGEQLERWIDVFGRNNIHVIVFDDFSTNTPGAFQELLTFLDVDPLYRPPSFAIHNASHRQRRGPVRALLDSRLAQSIRRDVLPSVLGQGTTSRVARSLRRSRLVRRPTSRAALNPDLLLQLQREFGPDVALLSELLDRDLGALWFGVPSRLRTVSPHAGSGS